MREKEKKECADYSENMRKKIFRTFFDANPEALYSSLMIRATYAANPKSRPCAEKRDGGGVGLPGTGSPRKTFALAR